MTLKELRAGVQTLSLALLTRSDEIQSREKTSPEHVADLKEAVERGDTLPPPVCFLDLVQEKLWQAGGFHTTLALLSAGITEYRVDVRLGTKEDAIEFSSLQNITHGLKRTNADKRRAVILLRSLPKYGVEAYSGKQLAKVAGVSDKLVHSVDEELGLAKRESFGVGKSFDAPVPPTDRQELSKKKSRKETEPKPTKEPERKKTLADVSVREPHIYNCPDVSELARTGKGQASAIVFDLSSPDAVAALAAEAPKILGTDQIMVVLAPVPSLHSADRIGNLIEALSEPSGRIVAGSKYRGGVDAARCQFIGLAGDLSKWKPKPIKREPLPPQPINAIEAAKQEERTV